MEIKYGLFFKLSDEHVGKITDVSAQGFKYHTFDKAGTCVKGQQYMLKSDFNCEPTEPPSGR